MNIGAKFFDRVCERYLCVFFQCFPSFHAGNYNVYHACQLPFHSLCQLVWDLKSLFEMNSCNYFSIWQKHRASTRDIDFDSVTRIRLFYKCEELFLHKNMFLPDDVNVYISKKWWTYVKKMFTFDNLIFMSFDTLLKFTTISVIIPSIIKRGKSNIKETKYDKCNTVDVTCKMT